MGVKGFGSRESRKLDMGRHRLEGNPPIIAELRRSARARRLSLRVSRLDGRVTLTMPTFAPDAEGIAFLEAKEDWLRKQLAGMAPPAAVGVGSTLPVAGVPRRIVETDDARVSLRNDAILLPKGRAIGATLRAFLRETARAELVAASDRYAARLNVRYKQIALRDTRSRWGSCTADGRLMYSWRLIMAPKEVLEYVAAHEVAHLVEMNHQPAFWRQVARLCPDYESHRQWLRRHADHLHRYQFDD